jgi:hypothetical protein
MLKLIAKTLLFLIVCGFCFSAMAADQPAPAIIAPSQQGWWYISAAPGFGIVEKVYQIEANKAGLFWEEVGANVSLESTDRTGINKVTWKFNLISPNGKANRLLKLTFNKPLAGMKFDVVAQSETGATINIHDDKRFFENSVIAEWPDTKIASINVTAHVHFKKVPTIKEFQLGRRALLKALPIDPLFHKDGVLYFFNPDGRTLHFSEKPSKQNEGIPISLLISAKPSPAQIKSLK